jgi:dimethylargininase
MYENGYHLSIQLLIKLSTSKLFSSRSFGEDLMPNTFTRAIVRLPGTDFAQGITEEKLGPPDYKLMLEQHQGYIQALETAGLEVMVLDPLPGFPDAYFVEDVAEVTPHVAVITRPGAISRRGEVDSIEPVLTTYRPVHHIESPGTLDGGDVLMIDNHFYIGISKRTNPEGAGQLGRILEEYGHTWAPVPVSSGLHLKTNVSYLGGNTLLVTNLLAGRDVFRGYDKILVEKGEERAANSLQINDALLVPKGFPKTKARLNPLGYRLVEVDASEARKMDGGLSCMSIRF